MICVWIMVFSLRRVTTSAEMQMDWRCIIAVRLFPTVHFFPTVLPPECNVNWGISNAKQLNSCAMQLRLVQGALQDTAQCSGGKALGAALPQQGGRPSWHLRSRSHNRRLVSTTQASIKSTAPEYTEQQCSNVAIQLLESHKCIRIKDHVSFICASWPCASGSRIYASYIHTSGSRIVSDS